MLNTMFPIFSRTPLLISYTLGPQIPYHGFIFLSCLPVILFLLMYNKMPETPHFLLLKNREDEATEALSWLRQLPEAFISKEINEIRCCEFVSFFLDKVYSRHFPDSTLVTKAMVPSANTTISVDLKQGSLLAGLYLPVESTTGHSKNRCATSIWATLWMSSSGSSLTANIEILGFMGNSIGLVYCGRWLLELVGFDPLPQRLLLTSTRESLSKKKKGTWKELFTKRGNVRAVVILSSLRASWQASGGSTIFLYAQIILQLTEISLRSDLCASVLAVVLIVGSLLSPPIVRRWGYKLPLIAWF
ncbi:hypothetical protein J6590_089979 [Homalodisca vitripennis]|nr:hypothetical protein J6590_089979 [Homalodisca vitripennis]